jgi:hypothetical protein
MSMGANALAAMLIDLGACDGLDGKNCAKATLMIVNMGDKGRPHAMRIMGDEFETFKKQWRKAYERLEAGETGEAAEKPVKKPTGGLWEDLSDEVE